MATRIRIRGGRVVDPAAGVDGVRDIVFEGGLLVSAEDARPGERVLDAAGLIVAPGFIDLHCHLREPGFEYKETVATGTAAAAAGGFTTVCAMPNTNPTADTASDIEWLLACARRDAVVRVLPIGTITKQQAGKELSELAEMTQVGAVGFSDDGHPVTSNRLMRSALAYSRVLDRPIIDHAEDEDLVNGGVMNEGRVSDALGLRGAPPEAEELAIARDIALARATGGRLHIAHLSTREGVDLVGRAKARGVRVTAEVTPHHLLLTEEWIEGSRGRGIPFDTACRVNPPLRTDADREALINGLLDGTIDAIATDHAPHNEVDKACEFDLAAPGISVLETALGLLMKLVHAERVPLSRLIHALTAGPAAAFGISGGTLQPGSRADITMIDPSADWTVDVDAFRSKGRNSPLHGQQLRGRVVRTIAAGEVVFEL
ncbi:MAG: dihydroorotase [Chloroflexota bacterium]